MIQGHSAMQKQDILSYPHKSFCWKNIATTHIASIGVGTILIASTYTQSTFNNVCGVEVAYTRTFVNNNTVSLCHAHTGYKFSYSHKSDCCWKKFGIQGNNCTYSFHWCWYNTDCIHLYPEHIHLCQCGVKLYT